VDASLTELVPRLFGSMAVVIGVMWFAARVMKNKRLPGLGGSQRKTDTKLHEIEVLSRQGLGKNANVTLIRAGGRTLVLGVTDAQVTLLTALEDEFTATPLSLVPTSSNIQRTDVPAGAELPSTDQAWKGLLEQVRERTVRRA
jgi:flagellar protein FliO/FliZ